MTIICTPQVVARSVLLTAAAALLESYALSGAAHAAALSKTEFTAMAAHCAPTVAVRTLFAVAVTESGLDPLALHDNTTGRSEKPETFAAAVADARAWVGFGHSVDIGLMQINSANLSALNMTVQTALDPCISMAGGGAVLQAAYGGDGAPADDQVALLMALSRYNTGSPLRGIMNGYARTIMANAEEMGPPLPVGGPARLSRASSAVAPDPDTPPAWNIGAVGAYAQARGALWLVALPAEPNASRAAIDPASTLTQPKPRSP